MIPLAKDTRESIGAFADKVENRSLLFEKMVLAKNWGHEIDGESVRFNDANRFNVLRATTGGTAILAEDRDAAAWKAKKGGKNANLEAYKAKVAGGLAGSVKKQNALLLQTRTQHSNHFLNQLETSYQGRIKTFVGVLKSRLLINMAGGVMENAGLALDRCFGLPYLPGTAIKGVARNVALWQIKQTENAGKKEKLLRIALLAFGFIGKDLSQKGDFSWAAGQETIIKIKATLPKADEFKGLCSFLPAYPCSDENLQIVAECMTPHPSAKDSATGKGNPHPLFYPAVEAGSSFAFAVLGQRTLPENILDKEGHQEVLQQAAQWVEQAIKESGIGAKTGAGYGWFDIDLEAEKNRREEAERLLKEIADKKAKEEAEKIAAQKEADRLASLNPLDLEIEKINKLDSQHFALFAKELEQKTDLEQEAFLKVIFSSVKKENRKRWKKKKPDIWNSITNVAEKHNIQFP